MFLSTNPIKCIWFRSIQSNFKFWWPFLIINSIILGWTHANFPIEVVINNNKILIPRGSLYCLWSGLSYRLITAYLLLWVNCDKLMHAHWNFDASNAWNRRVSALDKHQNWSKSASFCHNFRAQSNYVVINLIHTQHKQTCLCVCLFLR